MRHLTWSSSAWPAMGSSNPRYCSHACAHCVPCNVACDGTQCIPSIDPTHVLRQTYKLSGFSSALGVATTAHELRTSFTVETGPGLVLGLKVKVSRSALDSVRSICKKVTSHCMHATSTSKHVILDRPCIPSTAHNPQAMASVFFVLSCTCGEC